MAKETGQYGGDHGTSGDKTAKGITSLGASKEDFGTGAYGNLHTSGKANPDGAAASAICKRVMKGGKGY